MNSDKRYLTIDRFGQKRLQREFDDRKIEYGFNQKTKRNEVWYSPGNSLPYMITVAHDVSHAVRLLRKRLEFDKMRAKDLLRKIDENNDKIAAEMQDDAMYAVKSDLKHIAAGRRFYAV